MVDRNGGIEMKHRHGQPYFDLRETAAYLEVSQSTLIERLFWGGGPPHHFDKEHVLFRPTDIDYFRLMGGQI